MQLFKLDMSKHQETLSWIILKDGQSTNLLCLSKLKTIQLLTSGMELKSNYLVSGNADSTVKIWDIISGKCLHTLSGPSKHQSAVTSLHFNTKFVVTSSDDGSVKLWDMKTGEYIFIYIFLNSII